ncbi:MAG: hypothetical protein ACRBF0_23545 [Calditrichia bacterium]
MNDLPILFFLQLITDVLLSLIGLYFFRKASIPMKILICLFILHAIVDFVGVYLAMSGTQNLWLHHIYTPIEFALFMSAFAFWQEDKKVQSIMLTTAIIFSLICVFATFYLGTLSKFDSVTSSISRVILVGVAVHTLVKLYMDNYTSQYTDSRFWISAGVLTYFIGTIPIFCFSNQIIHLSPASVLVVWSVSWGVTTIANMLYAGGLFCPSHQ